LLEATLLSIPVERPEVRLYWQQNMCLDKGYDYDEVRGLLKDFSYTAHIRARGEEAQAIKRAAGFKARRWVVERTHSWMNRFRRILIRWEKKPATKAREGVNPFNGEKMMFKAKPASKKVRIAALKTLKEFVN